MLHSVTNWRSYEICQAESKDYSALWLKLFYLNFLARSSEMMDFLEGLHFWDILKTNSEIQKYSL